MDTGDWADIDGLPLDLVFCRPFRIIALRLAVLVEAEYCRKIAYAQTAADTDLLIHIGYFGHGSTSAEYYWRVMVSEKD
jgi:hypothetical protein